MARARTVTAETPRERPRDQVTLMLAGQVLSDALEPGDRVPTDPDLSSSLGVSPTALCEAIRTLAGKGPIKCRTHSGTVTLPVESWIHLDPWPLAWREEICCADVSEIESRVAADAAFLTVVLRASLNPFLAKFGAMIGTARRTAFRMPNLASENYAGTLGTHREVLEAIRLRHPTTNKDLFASASHARCMRINSARQHSSLETGSAPRMATCSGSWLAASGRPCTTRSTPLSQQAGHQWSCACSDPAKGETPHANA